MATSKLLKPTNVTISIPEFTDQPDQRVNSNCIDKEADAINTLSEHIGNLKAIHFFKSTYNLPSGSTDTYQISTVSDYTKCYVLSAGLLASGTIYNQAVEVQTVNSNGITCKNNGGAGGVVMLCVFEST